MKISFPTNICSTLDISTAAALASKLGFNGVELPAFADPAISSATNALLTSTEKINRIFAQVGVAVSSLNVGSAGSNLPARILLAAELNCPITRFDEADLRSRSLKLSTRAVDFVRRCADQAAAKQITLLLENQPIHDGATAMWHLLDRINHPAVACCWNTGLGTIAGDSPAVAVPTLNSRIQCVLLQNAATTQPAESILEKDSGTSYTPVHKTLDRLRGIGFQHGLIISPATAGSIEDLERSLEKSLSVLRQWKILPAPVPAI